MFHPYFPGVFGFCNIFLFSPNVWYNLFMARHRPPDFEFNFSEMFPEDPDFKIFVDICSEEPTRIYVNGYLQSSISQQDASINAVVEAIELLISSIDEPGFDYELTIDCFMSRNCLSEMLWNKGILFKYTPWIRKDWIRDRHGFPRDLSIFSDREVEIAK